MRYPVLKTQILIKSVDYVINWRKKKLIIRKQKFGFSFCWESNLFLTYWSIHGPMLFWYFPIFVCFHSGSSDSNSLNPFFFFSLSLLFLFLFLFFFIEEFKKESPYLVQFLHYHYGNQFIVLNSYLYKIKLHLQLVFF